MSSEEWGHSCLPSWRLRKPRLEDLLRKLPFSFNIYDFSPSKYSHASARVKLAGVDLFSSQAPNVLHVQQEVTGYKTSRYPTEIGEPFLPSLVCPPGLTNLAQAAALAVGYKWRRKNLPFCWQIPQNKPWKKQEHQAFSASVIPTIVYSPVP